METEVGNAASTIWWYLHDLLSLPGNVRVQKRPVFLFRWQASHRIFLRVPQMRGRVDGRGNHHSRAKESAAISGSSPGCRPRFHKSACANSWAITY